MKRIFSAILMVSAIFMLLLTGCSEKNKKNGVTTKVVAVGPAHVDIAITADGYISYAYICQEVTETAPTDEAVIFNSGTETVLMSGENTATIKPLKAMTDYTAYFAFKSTQGYSGKIEKVNFTTTSFTEVLTITNITHDGFSMHIEPPQDILDMNQSEDKTQHHVIRYAFTDFAYYNLSSNEMNAAVSDASKMILYDYNEYNGKPFVNFVKEPTDFDFYGDGYLTDENGEYIFNEEEESPVQAHRRMTPGEPVVLYIGEYQWGEGHYVEPGYYVPLFDAQSYLNDVDKAFRVTDIDESIYWSGVYEKIMFQTTPPTQLDSEFKVEYVDLKAASGKVRITPGEGIMMYAIWVMDNAFYKLLIDEYLLGHEEYMQWFTTSLTAFEQFGVYMVNNGDPAELDLDFLSGNLAPETDYHMLLVGVGDEKLTSQIFQHEKFSTTERQLAAPVLTVSADEISKDPYNTIFNVKATGSPVRSIKYAANYAYDWDDLTRTGLSYQDIVTSMGNEIDDPTIIAAINSADGFDFEIPSRDDATTIFAIVGYNEEDTYNTINAKDPLSDPAVAATRTPGDFGERVESELFEALKGDWTATYKSAIVGTDGSITPDKTELKAKVSIYNGIPYPENLSEKDYKVYADNNINKEGADKLYAEFKKEADTWNDNTRKRNRLTCIGLEDNKTFSVEDRTPYELFVDPEAGRATVASVFYAFGTKWFLEIDKSGNVTVPMSYSKMYPATAWQYPSDIYLCGVADSYIYENDKNNGYFNFPVVISEDKNTITIKPIVIDTKSYYMTLGYNFSGTNNWAFPSNRVINTEIVLTRGWTEPETDTAKPAFVPTANGATLPTEHYVEVEPKGLVLSRTPLYHVEPVEYQKIKITTDRLQ